MVLQYFVFPFVVSIGGVGTVDRFQLFLKHSVLSQVFLFLRRLGIVAVNFDWVFPLEYNFGYEHLLPSEVQVETFCSRSPFVDYLINW